MPYFQVNKNDPRHEVHSDDCGHLPHLANRYRFKATSFAGAVGKAARYFGTADFCGHCVNQIADADRRHTRRSAGRRLYRRI